MSIVKMNRRDIIKGSKSNGGIRDGFEGFEGFISTETVITKI